MDLSPMDVLHFLFQRTFLYSP